MRLTTFTNNDFHRAKCTKCSWISNETPRALIDTKTPCVNCEAVSYTHFPGTQSSHILGGMVHFIDSYNKKITSDRHIFPPQVYLPIIFACSNYETLLTDLVRELMKKYGNYIGRLGKLIVADEVLGAYDKRANERLFKALTLKSTQQATESTFPNYFPNLQRLYKVRNEVVHGEAIDNTQQALVFPNKGIALLLDSVHVFQHLHNQYVVKFEENIDYRKVLRLGDHENFTP